MINLNLKSENRTRNYLLKMKRYEFNSLMDLIDELFKNQLPETSESDNIIYELIKSMGYQSISEIPTEELAEIESYYYQLKEKEEAEFDREKLVFLLMAKLKNGQLLLMIDNQLINNHQKRIILKRNAVITFIDKNKVQGIEFKTL
jgi:hypothetical protein